MQQRGAFSLVELSIVLVILGLLTGGILAGQSLIRASELRKITTLHERYKSAVFSFRDKYFEYPGDFSKATQFWSKETVSGCVNASSAPVVATGTCDGNGDGIIQRTSPATSEHFYVWEHLAKAGLVEGGYEYINTTPLSEAQSIGVFLPALGVENASAHIGYYGPGQITVNVHGSTGHYLQFGGAATSTSGLMQGIMDPSEAWNIDTKIDDGQPGTGIFAARYNGSDAAVVAVRCVSSFSSATATYNFQYTAKTCVPHFKLF